MLSRGRIAETLQESRKSSVNRLSATVSRQAGVPSATWPECIRLRMQCPHHSRRRGEELSPSAFDFRQAATGLFEVAEVRLTKAAADSLDMEGDVIFPLRIEGSQQVASEFGPVGTA